MPQYAPSTELAATFNLSYHELLTAFMRRDNLVFYFAESAPFKEPIPLACVAVKTKVYVQRTSVPTTSSSLLSSVTTYPQLPMPGAETRSFYSH